MSVTNRGVTVPIKILLFLQRGEMTSFREISREELEQEFSPEEIEDSEQVRPSLIL